VSYGYWQRRFGGDASILGRDLPGTAERSTVIVGVLAPGFELLFPPSANIERSPDHWIASRLTYDTANRTAVSLRAIGRLKNGATLASAQQVVDSVAADLRAKSVTWETADFRLRLAHMQSHLVREVRPTVIVLMSAAIVLLLIACANVANLFLVRTAARGRELAVRRALGGTVWQLISPTAAEALVVAVLGAACGVGVAWLTSQQLHRIAPAAVPRLDSITVDGRVLAFTVAATAAAMALISLAPLWHVWRSRLADTLRAGARTPARSEAGRLRSGVVITAVALSFVLLTGSVLMIRSFLALQSIDPQFDPRELLTFQLRGSRGGAQPEQRAAFMAEIEAQLREIPGVREVTASTPFPLTGGFNATRWGTEAALADPALLQSADFQTVLPGYFETVRTPLLEGRTFIDADNAPGRNLVVIDELLAAKAFPKESAIGKRLVVRPDMLAEVIGVVAHQRATSLAQPGREQIYFTDGFMGHGVVSRWALRTTGNPAVYAPAVRAAIATLGSRVVLTELRTMDEIVVAAQATTRFPLLVIGAFGMFAGLLAAVGLYGLLTTAVGQRTAEIGIRMALGAAPASVFRLVIGHGVRLSAAGVAIGVLAAWALTRMMAGMLVGVQPTDPATFMTVVMVFMALVGIASWLPARRAAALDPLDALHEE
jgi:putative ABC transport system permease protein